MSRDKVIDKIVIVSDQTILQLASKDVSDLFPADISDDGSRRRGFSQDLIDKLEHLRKVLKSQGVK